MADTKSMTSSPALWFARVVGIVLVLIGLVGFFEANPLGIDFQLTTVHNWVHILTGLIALYFGFAPDLSRETVAGFAIAFGAVYLFIGILGLFATGVAGIILTMPGNILHFGIALLGIGLGATSLAVVGRTVSGKRPSV